VKCDNISDERDLVSLEAFKSLFNEYWLFSKDSVFNIIEVTERKIANSAQMSPPEMPEYDPVAQLAQHHGSWGGKLRGKVQKNYQLILPEQVERRCEALFEVLDLDLKGYITLEEVKEATGEDWSLVTLEMVMTTNHGEVDIEAWMRFFNRQWESSPDTVYLICESIESRLNREQTKRLVPFEFIARPARVYASVSPSRNFSHQGSESQGPGCFESSPASPSNDIKGSSQSRGEESPGRSFQRLPVETSESREDIAMRLGEWMRMTGAPGTHENNGSPEWAQKVDAAISEEAVGGGSHSHPAPRVVAYGRAGGGHDWHQDGYAAMQYPEATNLKHGSIFLYEASHSLQTTSPPTMIRRGSYSAYIPGFHPGGCSSFASRSLRHAGVASLPPMPTDIQYM